MIDPEEFAKKLAESVMKRILPLKERIAVLERDNLALRRDLDGLEAKMFGAPKKKGSK